MGLPVTSRRAIAAPSAGRPRRKAPYSSGMFCLLTPSLLIKTVNRDSACAHASLAMAAQIATPSSVRSLLVQQGPGRNASQHIRACTFEADDPLNPLNWSISDKIWITAQTLPFALMTVFNIGWYSAASADLRTAMSNSPSDLEMQLGNVLFVWAIAVSPLILAPFSECVVRSPRIASVLLMSGRIQGLRPQMVLPCRHHYLRTGFSLSRIPTQPCSVFYPQCCGVRKG